MPRNGSGVYNPPGANYPAVSGGLITAANRNAVDADIATALTGSIAVNGESVVTNNIPMSGNKLTGLGAGTAATDAVALSQVQSGVSSLLASVSGADTITATLSPSLAAYANGQLFKLVPASNNTGAVTININALGAKAVTKNGATALAADDLVANVVYLIEYDGTRFQVLNLGSTAQLALKANLAGATFTGDVIVPDEAYDATGWNGDLSTATKNAIRDKIVTMDASIAAVVAEVDVFQAGPIFSARNSVSQSIASGTPTKCTQGTEIYDTNTNFASSRFTPTVAGYYQINGILRGVATNLTQVIAILYVNGSEYRRGGAINTAAITASEHVTVSDVILFNGSTDYVELWGIVSGSSPEFDYTSATNCSAFSGHFVRPT